MHDIKYIRDNADKFDEQMSRRGVEPVAQKILQLDKENRGGISDLQDLQTKSNEMAKSIGALMAAGKSQEAQEIIAASKEIKAQIASLKNADNQKNSNENSGNNSGVNGLNSSQLNDMLFSLPNILDDNVPLGDDEDDNVEIRRHGDIPQFNFTPKQHFDIGENLQAASIGSQLDFEQTAKISGSRFATLKGDLALLERALAAFMLDVHTQEFGYEEISPPLLVRSDAMYGTSQLPKFADGAFKTTDDKWLISTSEISIVNQVREMIIDSDKLPIRFVGHTPCFRSESGSAGKDTRGLVRLHQFYKVELISITTAQQAEAELDRKMNCVEEILKRLELPYRVMLLCSKDTGFGAQKTYDMEVWMAGQDTYREISSCSICGDFQARRMNSRHRPEVTPDTKTEFVHTLNGSGLAVGRTIVAIMENYQNADGSINIPAVLQPYMNGKKIIKSRLTC